MDFLAPRNRRGQMVSHEEVELANDDSVGLGSRSQMASFDLEKKVAKVERARARQVVDLAFGGKSIEAIGHELNLSTGAVAALHRARQLLKVVVYPGPRLSRRMAIVLSWTLSVSLSRT
ncbi:MAG: hypothetical protein R3B54_07545 [Bdellovibrionota bacterium]